MMKGNRVEVLTVSAAAIAVLLGGPPAFAQRSGDPAAEFGECLEFEVPAERLACFERRVEQARQDAEARPPTPPTPPAPRTVEARPAPTAAQPTPAEFVARVTALRETIPDTYTITLDNGQIWRQNRPEAYPLRTGDEVRIYPLRKSYRLTAPRLSGNIQVERVR